MMAHEVPHAINRSTMVSHVGNVSGSCTPCCSHHIPTNDQTSPTVKMLIHPLLGVLVMTLPYQNSFIQVFCTQRASHLQVFYFIWMDWNSSDGKSRWHSTRWPPMIKAMLIYASLSQAYVRYLPWAPHISEPYVWCPWSPGATAREAAIGGGTGLLQGWWLEENPSKRCCTKRKSVEKSITLTITPRIFDEV